MHPISGHTNGVNPVNQTIIINNPNININYMNENKQLPGKGVDNWNLNNNLK